MIISVRIDCCAETWLEWSLNTHLFTFINKKSSDYKTQLSVKKNCCKVNTILIHVI